MTMQTFTDDEKCPQWDTQGVPGSEANWVLSFHFCSNADLFVHSTKCVAWCCLSGAMLRAGGTATDKINVGNQGITSPLVTLCWWMSSVAQTLSLSFLTCKKGIITVCCRDVGRSHMNDAGLNTCKILHLSHTHPTTSDYFQSSRNYRDLM